MTSKKPKSATLPIPPRSIRQPSVATLNTSVNDFGVRVKPFVNIDGATVSLRRKSKRVENLRDLISHGYELKTTTTVYEPEQQSTVTIDTLVRLVGM